MIRTKRYENDILTLLGEKKEGKLQLNVIYELEKSHLSNIIYFFTT